jgi:DNA-binding IclR family transcriptional regulator
LTLQIDEVLDYLALNEKPHSIKEISEALKLPYELCKIILDFLSKHGFVESENSQITLNPKMKEFITATSNKNFDLPIMTSISTISTSEK